MAASAKALGTGLEKASTEEQVKKVYIKALGMADAVIAGKVDLLWRGSLFEFKLDADLANTGKRAKVLAQAVYYLRRIMDGKAQSDMPSRVVAASRTGAVTIHSMALLQHIQGVYDFGRTASNPDPALVAAIKADPMVASLHHYGAPGELEALRELLMADECDAPKKLVSLSNFMDVYARWHDSVGQFIEKERRATCFLTALRGRVRVDSEGVVCYDAVDGATIRTPRVDPVAVEAFWKAYKRPIDPATYDLIVARKDCMTDRVERAMRGEFFTPLRLAEKCHEVLEKALGSGWQDDPDVRVWDPCCGSGNLEFHLKRGDNVYMSTLDADEAALAKSVCPGATVFQYDYLNDDVDAVFGGGKYAKLPAKLVADLANPKIKWVVLMNPPYAEATQGAGKGKGNKTGVSSTKVQDAAKIGKAGNELYCQFMSRVSREMPEAKMGVVATPKYITYQGCERIRSEIGAESMGGIVFSSKVFVGVNGEFPISFCVWNLGKRTGTMRVCVDVLDEDLCLTGIKRLESPSSILSGYVIRQKPSEDCPPMSMSGAMAEGVGVRLSKMAAGSLGYLAFNSNDVQSNQLTVMLSSAYYGGNGLSVTECDIDKIVQMWAVRRLVDSTWLNNKDLYTCPNEALLTPEFQAGCWAFCLWHASNKTTSLRGVQWDNKSWDVRNHFVAYDPTTMAATSPEARALLRRAKPTKVYEIVSKQPFSPAARAVMDAGMDIVRFFWASYDRVDRKACGIADWDAGFCQMCRALADSGATKAEYTRLDGILKEKLRTLRAELLPKVYEYGFLAREMLDPVDE